MSGSRYNMEAAASSSNGSRYEEINKSMSLATELLNMSNPYQENTSNGDSTIGSSQKVKSIQKNDKAECRTCKEKFVKGYWKEHEKTRTHILKRKQLKRIKMSEKNALQQTGKETYKRRPGSEENQQYINTLTAFLALRHALNKSCENFNISVNNQAWSYFGDIVFEFNNSGKQVIQCRKIQTKTNYTYPALGAETGNLSLKEQCEILKKLNEKEKVIFSLHTVSSVTIDNNTRFTYEDKLVQKWQKVKDAKIWKGKEVEIKLSQDYRKRDLFNTSDDLDDVLTFTILGGNDGNLNNDLCKFRMYIDQKKRDELKSIIRTMIEDKFNIAVDISDELIKYVKNYFKTDKAIKKKCKYFKMTKEDVLLKIVELLLVPYQVVPDHAIEEKKIDLWDITLQQFDVIIIKNDKHIVEKIYSSFNRILKEETNVTLNTFNNLIIDKTKIKNEKLKSRIFEDYSFDNSWQFLYLALWRTGLTPLVLKVDNEKNLNLIIDVISFFKTEDVPLKFIITTNLQPVHSCFPKHLKVFLNFEDLKIILDNISLDKILSQSIRILDFDVSLNEIERCNKDFFKNATPDVLLNMLLEDYSFQDISVPITKEIVDNTLVLDDESVNKVKEHFRERDGEKGLSYLVSLKGLTSFIEVPPDL